MLLVLTLLSPPPPTPRCLQVEASTAAAVVAQLDGKLHKALDNALTLLEAKVGERCDKRLAALKDALEELKARLHAKAAYVFEE